MADKRMLTKKITDSDAFLDMPLSTQALYLHLNMAADDDGFVNSPKRIQRLIGASEDDLKLLIAKSFLIPFDSGIIVIKHWRMHNVLQKDRYRPTVYTEEARSLRIKDNKAYTLRDEGTPLLPDTEILQLPERFSSSESSSETKATKTKTEKFKKPSLDEIRDYCNERQNGVDPERFYDFYESKGWKIGKNTMKDWKAAVRTWERQSTTTAPRASSSSEKITIGGQVYEC